MLIDRLSWLSGCYEVQLLGSSIALMLLVVGTTNAARDLRLNAELEETIAKVRCERSLTERINLAEHIADLTQGIDPKSVDDKTLADMVSLLDDPDEGVRGWVAAALGQLGRRAKVAVPKLLALLPAADCEQGELTSAPFIRLALEKMGVKPPPVNRENCK